MAELHKSVVLLCCQNTPTLCSSRHVCFTLMQLQASPVVPVDYCTAAGEAQKIDRIMERFAERYCKDNPDVFQTSDGAYLLSFALIMLNTDAHNPMADKKLSLEDFVSMCQYQVRRPRGSSQKPQ